MRNKTALLISLIVVLLSCGYNDKVKVQINSPTLPVLTGKEYNPVQQITLVRDNSMEYNIKKLVISLQGTTDSDDIAKLSLFKADEAGKFDTAETIAETVPKGNMATFTHHFPIKEDTLILWVSVTLKENIDLTHRVGIQCEKMITNKGKLHIPNSENEPLRTGVALRQHGQDGGTYLPHTGTGHLEAGNAAGDLRCTIRKRTRFTGTYRYCHESKSRRGTHLGTHAGDTRQE